MEDKFSAFKKAEQEVNEHKELASPKVPVMSMPTHSKERKEPMSLTFTPSHKKKAREIAQQHGMSVSELFAYWLDQY